MTSQNLTGFTNASIEPSLCIWKKCLKHFVWAFHFEKIKTNKKLRGQTNRFHLMPNRKDTYPLRYACSSNKNISDSIESDK